jgi:hypothetical protein
MGSETAGETAGDMHEFMDQGSLFILRRHPIKNLRDHFNSVRGWKVKDTLPNLTQAMDSSDGATGFGASTADAEDELRYDMVELAFFC